jgi:GNAT superfamily N-acetyltransferase
MHEARSSMARSSKLKTGLLSQPILKEITMSNISIRPAIINDCQTILHFITELAIYENAEHEVLATEQSLKQSLFSEKTHVNALICEHQGVAIGIAIYFYNYSTWLAKPGLYLEDLYISQEFRGQGAGKKLLQHLAKTAIDNHCGRFEWSCLDWNKPSRDFYEAVGAVAQSEWVGYRLSGQALSNFAKQS